MPCPMGLVCEHRQIKTQLYIFIYAWSKYQWFWLSLWPKYMSGGSQITYLNVNTVGESDRAGVKI